MNSALQPGTQETPLDLAPTPWTPIFNGRLGRWSIRHARHTQKGESPLILQMLTSLDETKDGQLAVLVCDAVNAYEPNKKLIEQLHAKLTCCCGDDVTHSGWAGHSPVSMYDNALDNANTRIAELEAMVAQFQRAANVVGGGWDGT